MARIEDGTGLGYVAKVLSTNRLSVAAAIVDEERESALLGEAWAVSSTLLTYTGVSNAALTYIRNDSTRDLIVDRIRLMLGTVTGGTGDWLLTQIRNPSAGTIITNASEAGVTNINHGSNTTPDGLFYKSSFATITAVNFNTLTGGTGSQFPIRSNEEGQLIIPTGRILPPGASFGILLQPPAGTTSANVNVVTRCYYRPGN
jgi:hypothetical protein